MVYFIFIFGSIWYFSIGDMHFQGKETAKHTDYAIFIIPFCVSLILLQALQNNVGTDYFSYYLFASGLKNSAYFYNRGEYIFYLLVNMVVKLGLPQLIFLFSGMLISYFYCKVFIYIYIKYQKISLFILLYFATTGVFFNQFNGIRQYIAVSITTYILVNYEKSTRYKLLLVIIASLIHKSAIAVLPLILFKKKVSQKNFILYAAMILIAIIFIDSNLSEWVLKFFPAYSELISSKYATSINYLGIISKLPKLFVSFYSTILLLRNYEISSREIYYLNMSVIGLSLIVLMISNSVFWRLFQYFDFFTIFPLFLIMKYQKSKLYPYAYIFLQVTLLLLKLFVFARNEYLYRSIL